MQWAHKIYFKNSLISFVIIGNPSRWAGVGIASVNTWVDKLTYTILLSLDTVLPKWLFTWQLGLGSLSWKWSERWFSSCSSWHFRFFALAKVKFGLGEATWAHWFVSCSPERRGVFFTPWFQQLTLWSCICSRILKSTKWKYHVVFPLPLWGCVVRVKSSGKGGNSLAVQWLKLHAPLPRDSGSIPG